LLLLDQPSPVAFTAAVDQGVVVGGDGSEGLTLGSTQVGVESRGQNAVLGDFIKLGTVVGVFRARTR